MREPKPREMEIAAQGSYSDGRWHFTVQAWIGTQGAADALIGLVQSMRDKLPAEISNITKAISE